MRRFKGKSEITGRFLEENGPLTYRRVCGGSVCCCLVIAVVARSNEGPIMENTLGRLALLGSLVAHEGSPLERSKKISE